MHTAHESGRKDAVLERLFQIGNPVVSSGYYSASLDHAVDWLEKDFGEKKEAMG